MVRLECPVCEEEIELEAPEHGEIIECSWCSSKLMVRRIGKQWLLEVAEEEESHEKEEWL